MHAEWAMNHTASWPNSSPWAYPVGYSLVISPRVRLGLGFRLDALSCERCRVESLIELLKQRKTNGLPSGKLSSARTNSMLIDADLGPMGRLALPTGSVPSRLLEFSVLTC